MTLSHLLDTNFLIELLRRNRSHPNVAAQFEAHRGQMAVSAISVMELQYGCVRSRDPEAMRRDTAALLDMLAVLPFDEAAAQRAGEFRAELVGRGTPIGPYDALIAGHALAHHLTVVTHNLTEFKRVPGLECEDWQA